MDLDAMYRAKLLGKRDNRYYDEIESREKVIADAIRARRSSGSSLLELPDDQLVQETAEFVFHPDQKYLDQSDPLIQKLIAHNNMYQYMELEDQQPQIQQRLRGLLGISPSVSISPVPPRRVFSDPVQSRPQLSDFYPSPVPVVQPIILSKPRPVSLPNRSLKTLLSPRKVYSSPPTLRLYNSMGLGVRPKRSRRKRRCGTSKGKKKGKRRGTKKH